MGFRFRDDPGCKFFDASFSPVECNRDEPCEKCGWNPEVAKERLAKIKAEMEKKDA